MIPTCPTWGSFDFLRYADAQRRFSLLTLDSTGFIHHSGNFWVKYFESRGTYVTASNVFVVSLSQLLICEVIPLLGAGSRGATYELTQTPDGPPRGKDSEESPQRATPEHGRAENLCNAFRGRLPQRGLFWSGFRMMEKFRSDLRRDYFLRAFSLSSTPFNSSSFRPASPSLPSAVRRW